MRNNSTSGMQDSGSMTMTKHRNNSISSNASQSSSSSMTQANKHPCKFPTCGWSFKRFEHLKRHMLVHTKERPFVCDFHGCEKSFSRSDNFSAHLRTHTKKAMHMRRFDRQLMEPIRTSFENAMPGPLSGTPGSAGDRGSIVDSHSGGMGGGDHAHHRHSIAGYPSFSDSRPPLQSQNNYSHGLPTPVHTNQSSNGGSRSARSSYYCPSDEQPDFDTKSSASSSSFGLSTVSLPRHSPSAMHPLDSPTSDGLSNIVPKFNTIKLDLKTASNVPEGAHKQRSVAPHGDERGYAPVRPRHHHSFNNGQTPYQRYPSPERGPKASSVPGSPTLHHAWYSGPSERGYDQQQYQQQQQQQQQRHSNLTGHENPNPNPNGESPMLTPRSAVVCSNGSGSDDEATNFPASISSHFMPAGASSHHGQPQESSIISSADASPEDRENADPMSSSNPSFTSFARSGTSQNKRNGNGTGEYSSMSNSSSYQQFNSGSVSPNQTSSENYDHTGPMDEDGNSLPYRGSSNHGGYGDHQRHQGGQVGYPSSAPGPPRLHLSSSSSSIDSSYHTPHHG
ncbi:hypothetical protein BGZ54_006179, partial [Gamsiella multidivaricata]